MTTTYPSNSATPNITIHNTNERHHTLITINIADQAPLKLTSNNYVSWKLQFHSLFIGYDLLGYIDGSKPSPPTNITQNDTTIPNPEYTVWYRQDQLILSALIGSLSPTIIPFIARAKTSQEAWTILANTYAKPTRGRIKQLKSCLKNPTKGSQSITEFLQTVKTLVDELAILGAPMDDDDLIEKILDGLGDDYKELVCAVQARDNPISFEELHDKLLNFEASIQGMKFVPAHFPASANPANCNNTGWRSSHTFGNNNNWRPPSNHNNNNTDWHPRPNSGNRFPAPTNTGPNNYRSDRPPPRPYLGHCQICGIQGHTAKKCPSFRLVPVQSSTTTTSSISSPQTPRHPRANCYDISSEEVFGSMSLPSETFTPENPPLLSDDNSNRTQEISHIGEQNVVKEMVGLDLDKSSNKKQKKLRSDVWQNFDKYKDENGKDWAKCNICEKLFDGSSKMGTTHLRNHFKSCSQNKKNKGGGSASGDKPAENSNQTQEISQIGEQNVVKETVGLDLGKSSNKKQKKLRSDVWDNFEKHTDENGKEWAICNICKVKKDGSSKHGTTHLRNHFNSCSKNKSNEGGGSASGDKPAGNSVIGGYNDSMPSGFPMQPQNLNVNAPTPLVSASQQVHLPRSDNLLALGPSQSSSLGFQSLGTSNPNTYRGVEDFFSSEDEIRMRSHEMLENDDMQHRLRIFNMGARGQGQGSFNATEYGYPYSSPFMSNRSPNYNFDGKPSHSSGKAVVGWLKLKAAVRWTFFIRKKAAERRAQIAVLDEMRMRSHEMLENDDMQHRLRIFNMGGQGQGQGQGSFNATEYGYPYSSPFMSNRSPNYSFDGEASRSLDKAVVGWLKLKAAVRWAFFIRKKAAKRRAQIAVLDEMRMRSHEMLVLNDDMQHGLRIFNMGGRGQGQGSFNATEYGYPYLFPFMSNPSPNYSSDDEPCCSLNKAVVGWLKLKAAVRWAFFIRKKVAERRAQLVELDEL